MKTGIGAGAHDEKKIAGRAAVDAGVALALQADALAVARAWLDAKLDRLGAGDSALAVAGGAVVRDVAGAVAARAGDVELHAAAHLRHLAGAVALGALRAAADVRLAVAGGAGLLAVDLDARLAAADGGPEIDGGLVLEVGAGLRAARLLRCCCAPPKMPEKMSLKLPEPPKEPVPPCAPMSPWKPEKSKPPKSTGGWPPERCWRA